MKLKVEIKLGDQALDRAIGKEASGILQAVADFLKAGVPQNPDEAYFLLDRNGVAVGHFVVTGEE